MGKLSLGLEDPYYPVLTDMTEDTIVIALSVSGETELVIDLLNRFQKHKCKLLSITNDSTSTIAKMSDWNITYNMAQKMREPIYNVTTQVPVIFLIEALARRL
jgi:DNA-binding MurR/RpiR family transcriptional regulator